MGGGGGFTGDALRCQTVPPCAAGARCKTPPPGHLMPPPSFNEMCVFTSAKTHLSDVNAQVKIHVNNNKITKTHTKHKHNIAKLDLHWDYCNKFRVDISEIWSNYVSWPQTWSRFNHHYILRVSDRSPQDRSPHSWACDSTLTKHLPAVLDSSSLWGNSTNTNNSLRFT